MRGDSTFLHFLLKMRQTRLRMLRTRGLSEVTWTALCGTPTIYLHFTDIISSPASSHYPMRKVRLGKTEQPNTASKGWCQDQIQVCMAPKPSSKPHLGATSGEEEGGY